MSVLTSYQITIWKLTGKLDEVDSVFECSCETEWQVIEVWDCLLRGVRGHYKAWCVDVVTGRTLRESSLTWKDTI